jgi:hypothetical protein
MDSMPPATTTSNSPAAMSWAAHLVNGERRHGHGDAAGHGRLPGRYLAGARLQHLAHDHVVHLVTGQGRPLQGRLDGDAA